MSTFISKEHERKKKRVEALVSDWYDVTLEELHGQSKSKRVVTAKHICFFLLKRDFGMYPSLIAALYKMDHSSIINGIRRVVELKLNKELKEVHYPHFPLS